MLIQTCPFFFFWVVHTFLRAVVLAALIKNTCWFQFCVCGGGVVEVEYTLKHVKYVYAKICDHVW